MRARLRARRPGTRGQAAVELVALAPLVCLATAALVAVFLTARVLIAAEHALGAGIRAEAAGGDPVAAAHRSLPDVLRPRAEVALERGRLRVRIARAGAVAAVTTTAVLAR